MSRADAQLPLAHALALGLMQGPTELLPISSSGHTALVPWLAHWPYRELDGQSRKTFEVALHAGAGAALSIELRRELLRADGQPLARRLTVAALSLAPPALTGLLLGAPIERRLGGPRSVAAGLIAGAVAMALADARRPQTGRRKADARAADGLALGLAQVLALAPGVSRNGATLAMARARGFARADAHALSWHAALPVLAAASARQGGRLLAARRATRRPDADGTPQPHDERSEPLSPATLAAGAGTAFASTLASARLLRGARHSERSLLPYSLYRCLLGALVIARLRNAHRRD